MTNNSKVKNLELPKLYRYLYLISGILLVAIGVIGIFLPVLPTTIFLILASACFVKSSPRANEWLKKHKILGMYIKNYQDKTGLTVKAKVINISLLWIMILLSAFYFTNEFYIRIILLMIAVGVTIHLLMIKLNK
ncbi:YbaN family protein [Ignavibacterium sp.]|uniref:YbaN family protein n=1 Tax=Ignavibacterium sp. TaxID=2651167 RepID=UPI00307CEFAD